MADTNIRRIVLLGNCGSGKSSLANTLFGEADVFPVNNLPNSDTKLCVSKTKTVNGRRLQLIDTPGFFDTDPRRTELSPELLKCMTECAPGPHAFLLVLKVKEYTELEQMTLALTLKYFSEEALKYTTVVFTHGDQLPDGTEVEEWVGQNEHLRNLVQKCGGRRHIIDNECWKNSQDQHGNNQCQIEQLLQTIEQTVGENNGGYYTNELLQQITENDTLSVLINIESGLLLGAFLGGIGEIESEKDRAEKEREERAATNMEVEKKVQSYAPLMRAGFAGMTFLAGKMSARWSSPTVAVEDMTKFTKQVGDLFVELRKTTQAAKDLAAEFTN